MTLLLIAIGILLAVFAASFVVEALRQQPAAPAKLYWARSAHPLHRDRRQSHPLHQDGERPHPRSSPHAKDPARHFREGRAEAGEILDRYAADYPGHGFSDIPKADYAPELFVKAVEGFLDKLDLHDVTLAGISIGGVIPLIIAAKHNPRVTKVVAINPYDYGGGTGLARANGLAWLNVNVGKVPVVGRRLCACAMPMCRSIFFRAASPIHRP